MPLRSTLLIASAFAAALALAPAASAKEWKTVTIATEGAYEPWNLTAPDGSVTGFEPELLKDLCGRMHVECKIITQDWDGMIASLTAGKFDVIMDGLAITEDRAKTIGFSTPYAATPAAFVATKDGGSAGFPGTGSTVTMTDAPGNGQATIDGLRAAAKGKTIGIQTATSFSDFIYKNFKDVATIREYKTAPEHDLDLNAGRIDLAFDDVTYFTSAFARPENKDFVFTGPQIAGSIWGPGEGFGLRKTDDDLAALFNTAIKAAIDDGTVKTLSLKWFKVDITPR